MRLHGKLLTGLLLLTVFCLAGCAFETSEKFGRGLGSKAEAEPKKVALMLPMHGRWSQESGQICKGVQGRFYKELQARPDRELRLLDSSAAATAILYHQAVDGGSEILIGPLTKTEIASVSDIAELTIPVLALNNVELANYVPVKNLYYLGPSPESEVIQLTTRLEQDGLKRCALIVDGSKNSKRLAGLLESHLARSDVRLSKLELSAQDNISKRLCRFLSADGSGNLCNAKMRKKMNTLSEEGASSLTRQDLDAVILLAEPKVTAQLVPLLHFYYVEQLPILSLSSGYDLDLSLADLEGLEFLDMPYAVRPAIVGELRDGADDPHVHGAVGRSVNSSRSSARRLYAVGADAYWIASNFNRFMYNPSQMWEGASGKLRPIKGNLIFRQLSWIKVRGGKLEVID